jgi:hypothetical protein
MPISMNPAARYVTQSNIWGTCYTGKLTNRRINKYKKLGYYKKTQVVARATQRKAATRKKRETANDLLRYLGL